MLPNFECIMPFKSKILSLAILVNEILSHNFTNHFTLRNLKQTNCKTVIIINENEKKLHYFMKK